MVNSVTSHGKDVVAHDALFIVAKTDLLGRHRDPADVTSVRTLVILVVKDNVEAGRSCQPESERDDHVLHREIDPTDRAVVLPVLCANEHAISNPKPWNNDLPVTDTVPLKVIGEQRVALSSNQRRALFLGNCVKTSESEGEGHDECS